MGLEIGLVIRPQGGEEELEAFRREAGRLRAAGHRVTPRVTFEAGDALRYAGELASAGHEVIIAAGGDGTVNEVVNGIRRCRWQPRLGIVPVGTANDFAAGLGLPREIEAATTTAVEGVPLAADVARVNGRRFINVSTGGFGAEATERTSPEIKRRLGSWAYVITGVRNFAELKPARARFTTSDGTLYDGRFLIFAVGNARQTGGGSRVTPRARFGDGKLDVLVVPAMPVLEFLSLLPEVRAGRHLDHPGVIYVQTPTLTVEAMQELSTNADGELMRGRRFHYRLEARPLSVMTPWRWP